MKKGILWLISACIIVCVFCVSCKKEQERPMQYAKEHLSFDISKSIILDCLDSIEVKQVVKLEFDSDNPIGQIDKLIVTRDRIFVLDRTFSKYIYVYSLTGKLLYKIGGSGNGPGEYFNGPKDFYVDERSSNITVFESESKKLYTYDWNGKLIESHMLDKTWPYAFAKMDSTYYFAYKTVDKKSYLLQIQDEHETSLFRFKKLTAKREVVSDNCFYIASGKIYFVEDYNNDVVVIKNRTIEKILSIDFGENAISEDFLYKYKGKELINKALANEKATNISQIVETENLFAFQFMYKKMRFQIIQNKQSGNYLCGVSLNFGLIPSEVYTNYENNLATILPAGYLDVLLAAKNENPEVWQQFLAGAHPAIQEILLQSQEGRTSDYLIIYELHLNNIK